MNSIYLDNAATSYPKPENVKKAVFTALTRFGANPGRSSYKMSADTSLAVYEARSNIARFFNFNNSENVIFTKNCTEAINIVLFSILKSGDHVLISDLEHNSVVRPIEKLTETGVSYTIIKTSLKSDEETIDNFRKAIKPNTRLVVCTAASNAFGMRLPFVRIAALCHIYDIKFCLDAAQAAGIVKIDMENTDIDYLCAPGHKGLFGIMGTGILLTKNKLSPLLYGGTGTSSLLLTQPVEMPEALESGTLNVPGILSISAGIDFINHKKIEKILIDELQKTRFVYKNLEKNHKITLYTDIPCENKSVPVLSFNVKNKNCEDVADFLSSKGIAVRAGLHCSPLAHKKMGTTEGTVRISPCVFTDMNNLNYLVKCINNI